MENVMICVNTYCLNFKYKINDMFNISILLLITIYLIKKSFNIFVFLFSILTIFILPILNEWEYIKIQNK
jgi:hypothetical protein